MKFSNYIQQCLKELESAREYETDVLLVHLIKLQHLTEKIYSINSRDDLSDNVPGIPRAPISAYQSAFQAELDKIQTFLPKSLRNNRTSAVCVSDLAGLTHEQSSSKPIYIPQPSTCTNPPSSTRSSSKSSLQA